MTENMEAMTRVCAVHRERYAIRTGAGEEGYARLKAAAYRDAGARDYPTVGDFVRCLPSPLGDAWITGTMPRRSLFARHLPGKTIGEQAIAANFDEVFILASLNRDFNIRRIERYVSIAWQSGATPVVVLTKLDLAPDTSGMVAQVQEAAPGVGVHAVSALTGEGMDALQGRLRPGMTVVLLGSSGVGKSSLVNALAGETVMDTGAVRADDARGRHTTTHRQLLVLPSGAEVIDTPGMRELGLWDAEEGVEAAFSDIDALAAGCRFSDCAHGAEPGCAVKAAIAEGRLEEGRLRSYHRLRREAARRKGLAARKR